MKQLAASGLALMTLSSPYIALAETEQYAVRKIKFTNRGNYVAQIGVRWVGRSGAHCEIELGELGNKDTKNIDLWSDKFKWIQDSDKEKCSLSQGKEVWGMLRIYFGDTKSCQKTAKFRTHRKGGTLHYRSDGTAWQNNRCRIRSKPDTTWPIEE